MSFLYPGFYEDAEKRKVYWLPEMHELGKQERWNDFIDFVAGHYEVMPDAFNQYFPKMPDEYKRKMVKECYQHNGEYYPECVEAIINLPCNGVNELPSNYANKEVIAVYRGDYADALEDDIEFAPSWTLSIDVARFFRNRKGENGKVYKGYISPSDVIAYIDDREEKEVIQFGSVYSVEIIE
ncbi:hypothetical protein [Adlercreutzia sp. ZJ154]|uniref:hypothetical protein n=1 Tax=Adlercreutzia sp. ZJ154 TaxID=2709790 RepID=UPI0013EC1577|nr:hypothetical protein [Adlercreutzia sp. ZJ154]